MDPIYALSLEKSEDLLRFFRRKKTELSCMENPQTFLRQLRDHDLIPEDRYEKVKHMRSKENLKTGVYEVLDRLEREQPGDIRLFWECAFEDAIRIQYPTLHLLRNSIMDGSYRDTIVPKRMENKRKELSDEEDEEDEEELQRGPVKKKSKKASSRRFDDDERPGPSSLTPGQSTRSKKICYSPIKKGEKKDVFTWPLFTTEMPVTCGNLKGSLNRKRLAAGGKCIYVNKRWLTPAEFEKLAGKHGSKNWKQSIKCQNIALGKLIQKRVLKSASYKRGSTKARKSLFPPDGERSESDGEEDENGNKDEECEDEDEDETSSNDKESSTDEEQTEQQQQQDDKERRKMVFKVKCGALTGRLHNKRFASGNRGKSIRTDTSWMTPEEFMKEALGQSDACWQKNIKWEGKPLGVLILEKFLRIHSLLCKCSLCSQDEEDLENQRNDDECWVCRSGESELVQCDYCPRSFHQKCHLPHVEDAILGEDEPWMCSLCDFTHYRNSDELEMEAALSQHVSQHMLGCQYLLLYLCGAHEDQTLASAPDGGVQNGSTEIQSPTWFYEAATKLQGTQGQTVAEFVSDVQLVLNNHAQNNQDAAEFFIGRKEFFDIEFRNVFNIPEESDG